MDNKNTNMEDIELIIKIPKDLYGAYKGRPPMLGDAGMDMIAQSIANGTPLPKGHGRLIDADKAKEDLANTPISRTGNQFERYLDKQQTLIKADKAEEVQEPEQEEQEEEL